jgi:hypothetical protein
MRLVELHILFSQASRSVRGKFLFLKRIRSSKSKQHLPALVPGIASGNPRALNAVVSAMLMLGIPEHTRIYRTSNLDGSLRPSIVNDCI